MAADDNQYIDQVLACLTERIRNRTIECLPHKVPNERERALQELNLLKMLGRRIEDHIVDTTRRVNALAPIHRLPNELLTVIFAQALLPDQDNPGVYSQLPEPLCLVSKRWKGIIHESPLWWADISSSDPNPQNIVIPKGFPVHVYYDDNDFIDRGVDEKAFPNLVIEEAYRWRLAEFVLHYRIPSYDLLDTFISLPVPYLETLKIEVNFDLGTGPNFDIFSEGADRLRHVELYDFPIHSQLQMLSGLETLKISNRRNLGPSVSELIGILRRCPALRVFELRYTDSSKMHTSSIPPSEVEVVYLPTLISFTLSLDHAEAFSQVISSIHIPACKTFELECNEPLHNILSTRASHLTPAFLSVIQTTPEIWLWLQGRLLRLCNASKPGINISLAHYSPWEDLSWLHEPTTAEAVTLPPIYADITCNDTPFLQVADLLHNLLSITTMTLTGNSDQYIAHPSHPTLRNGIHEWVLPNLRALRLDACLENSLQLLADLSDKRHQEADMDRGDGVGLGLPRQLEWIYVPEKGRDRKLWTGPFYTALQELKGDDWDRNMISHGT